jgi:hypothetical protein
MHRHTGRHTEPERHWSSQAVEPIAAEVGLSSELSHHILLRLQLAFEFPYLLPLLLDKGIEASRLRILAVI